MQPLISRLGKSALLVLLAFGCTYVVWPLMYPVSLGTFYLAIAVASWRYGRLEGLISTALSVLLINYNFVPPLHSMKISNSGLLFLAEFAAIAVAVSYAGSSTRDALMNAEREADRLRVAERELAKSEARWRVLAESVPNMIWTCTPDGAVDYVSPQWRSYTGESPASHVGYRWLRAIHPDDRDVVCERWDAAVRDRQPFETICRIRSAQSTYRRFKMLAIPVGDSRDAHWIGSSTDVDDVVPVPGTDPDFPAQHAS